MKKLVYVVAVLALLWLLKISYDGYQLSAQVSDLKTALLKSEQSTAHLNDQLVALQRKAVMPAQNTPSQTRAQDDQKNPDGLDPLMLIKQQLELVKFAVDQHQYIYAIEQLNQTEHMLSELAVAETLKQSLRATLAQDKQMIQQYASTLNAQYKQLNEGLKLLDRSLRVEQNNHQLKVVDEKDGFFSRWFNVQRIEQAQPQLLNRKLILKEQQLRIISAQQALNRADFIEYQAILSLIEHDLNQLPDAYSVKLKQSIQSLRKVHLVPLARLSSLAILES